MKSLRILFPAAIMALWVLSLYEFVDEIFPKKAHFALFVLTILCTIAYLFIRKEKKEKMLSKHEVLSRGIFGNLAQSYIAARELLSGDQLNAEVLFLEGEFERMLIDDQTLPTEMRERLQNDFTIDNLIWFQEKTDHLLNDQEFKALVDTDFDEWSDQDTIAFFNSLFEKIKVHAEENRCA